MKVTKSNTLVVSVADFEAHIEERTANFVKSCNHFGWPLKLYTNNKRMTSYIDTKWSWLEEDFKFWNKDSETQYVVFLDCTDTVVLEPWERFIYKLSKIELADDALLTGAHRNDYPALTRAAEKVCDREFTPGGFAMVGTVNAHRQVYSLMKDICRDYNNGRKHYELSLWSDKGLTDFASSWMSSEADNVTLLLAKAAHQHYGNNIIVPDVMNWVFGRYEGRNYKSLKELRYCPEFNKPEDYCQFICGASTIHLDYGKFDGPLNNWFDKEFLQNS